MDEHDYDFDTECYYTLMDDRIDDLWGESPEDRWWIEVDDRITLNSEVILYSDTPDDFDWYEQRYLAETEWQAAFAARYVPTYSGGTSPRTKTIDGDEVDVIEGRSYHGHFFCYTTRPRVTSKIKRAIRRRERHNWRKELEL